MEQNDQALRAEIATKNQLVAADIARCIDWSQAPDWATTYRVLGRNAAWGNFVAGEAADKLCLAPVFGAATDADRLSLPRELCDFRRPVAPSMGRSGRDTSNQLRRERETEANETAVGPGGSGSVPPVLLGNQPINGGLQIEYLDGELMTAQGLAVAWLAAYPLYLLASSLRALPAIGARARDVAASVLPPLAAAAAMGLVVTLVDMALPPLAPVPRLAILVATGALVYGATLFAIARSLVEELIALARR